MKISHYQQPNPTRLLRSVAEKLHPKRFPKMSGRMAAIVAFLIDARVTRPTIAEIVRAIVCSPRIQIAASQK